MSGDLHGPSSSPPPPPANGLPNGDAENDKDDPDEEGEDAKAKKAQVSPEMLFKISKKIAQLTKVIYSLNTRNDDLELELSALRALHDGQEKNGGEEGVIHVVNGDIVEGSTTKKRRSKTPEAGDSETKKELKRARHIMRHLEGKMKAMEEQHRKQLEEQVMEGSSHTDKGIVEKQLRQANKDKQEMTRKVDHLEVKNEQMRLENEQLRKDIKEASKESSEAKLQLSAARVQLKYNRETGVSRSKSVPNAKEDDELAEELMQKCEALLAEKTVLNKELQTQKMLNDKQKRQLEASKKEKQLNKYEEFERQKKEERRQSLDSSSSQDELLKLRREKAALQTEFDQFKAKHEKDVKGYIDDKRKSFVEHEQLKNAHECESRKNRALSDRKDEEVRSLKAELERIRGEEGKAGEDLRRAREELATVQERVGRHEEAMTSLRKERERWDKELSERQQREKELLLQMGQKSEALVTVQEKSLKAEREREELNRKLIETKAKMDLMERRERDKLTDQDERASNLEKALEEALIEREEILEAAAKEIENAKTIAIQNEQKMMDDFEWKLREIEGENRKRVKDMEKSLDTRLVVAKTDFENKKDAEFMKMSIDLRREMEDQMRMERNSLKQVLDAQNNSDKDSLLTKARHEKDRALRMQKKTWEEDKNKLEREKRSLQRKVDDLPNLIAKATKDIQAECDAKIYEERRQASKTHERNQEEYDRLRDELNGQMTRLRADHAEKLEELESRLENANTNRFSSMFQMKEEVETEFSERMEQLRSMYLGEIEVLTERLDSEKELATQQAEALNETINQQRAEIDELNTYYLQREEEYETKVTDLLTRLQEQTTLAQKLQTELDEYDFYEEDEEGNITEKPPPSTKEVEEKGVVSSAIAGVAPLAMHAVAAAGGGDAVAANPNPPPRTRERDSNEEARRSWQEESPRTTAADPSSSNPETLTTTNKGRSNTLPSGRKKQAKIDAKEETPKPPGRTDARGSSLTRIFHSPKLKKRSSNSTGSAGSKKSNCAHQ